MVRLGEETQEQPTQEAPERRIPKEAPPVLPSAQKQQGTYGIKINPLLVRKIKDTPVRSTVPQ